MSKKALVLSIIAIYTFIIIPVAPAVWAQDLKLPPDSDRTPPVIQHQPQDRSAPSGNPLLIEATVTDNAAVSEVTLYYRVMGNVEYFNFSMKQTKGDLYSATIPAEDVIEPGMEYYIQAADKAGNVVLRGFSFSPLVVTVAPVLFPVQPVEKKEEKVKEAPVVEVPPAERPLLKTEEKPKGWAEKNWWILAILGGVVVAAAAGGGGGGGGGNGGGAPTTGSVSISGPLP